MHVLQTPPVAKPRLFIFLLQLGGPKALGDIPAFLTELFADVLPLPQVLKRPLAAYIARRRTPEVLPLYQEIGGGSPLLANTTAQAEALVAGLSAAGVAAQVGLAMRYAPPRLADALAAARALPPEVPWLALPLYPQYSFATTRSSMDELYDALTPAELDKLHVVEAYPVQPQYLNALAETVLEAMDRLPAAAAQDPHVVFSAHGLPMKLVREGDPYPAHIAATMAATLERLAAARGRPIRHTLSYQSRVGPVKWLTPSTEDTLKRLGEAGERAIVVVPIAFVSEHIETLHELDIQLRETAVQAGVTHYVRAPTVSVHPAFVAALVALCQAALLQGPLAHGASRCGSCPKGRCRRRLPTRCGR